MVAAKDRVPRPRAHMAVVVAERTTRCRHRKDAFRFLLRFLHLFPLPMRGRQRLCRQRAWTSIRCFLKTCRSRTTAIGDRSRRVLRMDRAKVAESAPAREPESVKAKTTASVLERKATLVVATTSPVAAAKEVRPAVTLTMS